MSRRILPRATGPAVTNTVSVVLLVLTSTLTDVLVLIMLPDLVFVTKTVLGGLRGLHRKKSQMLTEDPEATAMQPLLTSTRPQDQPHALYS
jgi:hypothetical protein